MGENRRVYPGDRQPGKWLSYLLLFLSAVVILSGVARQSVVRPTIETVPGPTPIPLEEAFDETPETRELTLPGTVWYALQLGAFEDEAAAEQLAEQYRIRGAAGYVWPDGRYRTLAALYPTREDAQLVRRQLSELHSIEAFLYEIPLQALTVRVRGMRGQIDILEAAFLHAGELIVALQECSVLLDRQEMNGAEYRDRLMALRSQTELVKLRLEQRFRLSDDDTVRGLGALFGDYADFCAAWRDGDSAAQYSRQIKHQAIRTLWLLRGIVDSLGNT